MTQHRGRQNTHQVLLHECCQDTLRSLFTVLPAKWEWITGFILAYVQVLSTVCMWNLNLEKRIESTVASLFPGFQHLLGWATSWGVRRRCWHCASIQLLLCQRTTWGMHMQANLTTPVRQRSFSSSYDGSAVLSLQGDLVYVNYGRTEDFFQLKREMGINVTGKIVIVRYGRIFRGNKVWNQAAQLSGNDCWWTKL